MSKEKVAYYEKTWRKYDKWYDTHKSLYQTEIKALEKAMPSGRGLEIGVGTGRFASPLSVRFGLDPSFNMLKLAKQDRQPLPFPQRPDGQFDEIAKLGPVQLPRGHQAASRYRSSFHWLGPERSALVGGQVNLFATC